MTKLYSLKDHPDHEAQLKPWADQWIGNALSTKPMDDEDRKAMRRAMDGLYRAANLEPPTIGVFVGGPITGAIAASVASGVWWLRENPGQQRMLFGRVYSEDELMATVAEACAQAVSNGMRAVHGLPPLPAATYAATYAATDAATYAATYAATDAATRAATYAATSAATDAATRAATYAATDAATYVATSAATYAATDAATYVATSAATDAATYVATSAATDAATRAATYAATDAATRAATRAATDAATDAATRAATYVATSAATYAATYAATDAATYVATSAATDVATYAATSAATSAATRAELGPVANFLVRCCGYWWRFSDPGNMGWGSAWNAYLSFFQEVAGLGLPIYDKYEHYKSAAIHAGYRFQHQRFWIASDRPTTIGRDDQNRPHCDTGPQLAWRDGWSVYYVHGVRVPRQVIEAPETLSVEQIRDEQNAEVRRVMLNRYGEARYLQAIGASLVHEDEFGQLYRTEIPGDEPLEMVRVINSTPEPEGFPESDGYVTIDNMPGLRKVYWLRVAPGSKTAQEAVASTWRYSADGARVFPRGDTYTPDFQS